MTAQKSDGLVEMAWDPITRIVGSLGIHTKIDFKQKIVAVQMDIDLGGSKITYDSTKADAPNNALGDFFKALVGSEFTLTIKMPKDKQAEVTKVEGRHITFKVTARDQTEEIGSGTHERAVIDRARLDARLAKKRR